MAKYTQYLFNLQHNTGCIVIEQLVHLNVYAEQAAHTAHELERMSCENRILRQGTIGATEKDLEL
jgi:trans-2-enoyl-CoA reductase